MLLKETNKHHLHTMVSQKTSYIVNSFRIQDYERWSSSSSEFVDWENHLLWPICDSCYLDIVVFLVVEGVQLDSV